MANLRGGGASNHGPSKEMPAVENMDPASASASSAQAVNFGKEIYDSSRVDPILAEKMVLVNNAIEEIGMTPYQWKLFLFNSFGYAVDSLLIVCSSIAQPAVDREFGRPNQKVAGVSLATQIGLLAGAAIWGFTADIIGRKLAFNSSLFIFAAFVLLAGAMPNYISFSAMVAISSAGTGGNYLIDSTSLLEFLPGTHTWLATLMSIWWSVGCTVIVLLAWFFMSIFSCPVEATPETCPKSLNWGWRYLHFTAGTLVLLLSVARLLFFRMKHTPRWLLTQNSDAEASEVLENLATQYNCPFSLRQGDLELKGQVLHTEVSRWSPIRLRKHFAGLFETRLLTYSSLMVFANWFIVGLASPLYSAFLPYYLASRGADVSGPSTNDVIWRNYAINRVSGMLGLIVA